MCVAFLRNTHHIAALRPRFNEHIISTGAQYVAAQVGDDVWVFADTNGDSSDGADVELLLVGRTLADISLLNFV